MTSPRLAAVVVCSALALSACDDQIKRVPLFKTMSWQASVEAFEEAPRGAVPGTMPIDGERTYGLMAADTAMTSPLTGGDGEVARGAELFRQFCAPCHGASGAGDGSVVGPNRIPALPFLNLRSELARGYSDGYLWGMITNGRGLMPSYRRIPAHDRWYVVEYIRSIQADAVAAGEIPPLPGETGTPVGSGEDL